MLTLLDGEDLTVAEIAALTGWKTSKVRCGPIARDNALRRCLVSCLKQGGKREMRRGEKGEENGRRGKGEKADHVIHREIKREMTD